MANSRAGAGHTQGDPGHLFMLESKELLQSHKLVGVSEQQSVQWESPQWPELEQLQQQSEWRNHKISTHKSYWHKQMIESTPTRRTSLVVQWLRIHLPMQGTHGRTLVRKASTCRGVTKPMTTECHALETISCNHWNLCTLELVFQNERS